MEEELRQPDTARLRDDVESALRRALDPTDVLPLLHRLARTAPDGSDESTFAHRHMAELVAPRHPWRGALYARKVLAHRPDDDRAWAVLALSQTLLGNFRFAVSAYHKALSHAPANPWYAHNLGHLLDVALGEPESALVWLEAAYGEASSNPEIAASYAHALARAGKLAEAKEVLSHAMKRGGGSREHAALMRWLDQGAPPEQDASDSRKRLPVSTPAVGIPNPLEAPEEGSDESAAQRASRRRELDETLVRGLGSLPLDARQRARARRLARDVSASWSPGSDRIALESLAAAIAYAIVYVDEVPLTQAEVAGSFRVSVSRLRNRFAQLRTKLELARGDARYGSPRP